MAELHRPLDPVELRVVGALLEKELSTPDSYPLTLNALLAACNQSSNRDPVVELEAAAVEQALMRLMADVLVWRDRGARTLRWKHDLDGKLGLEPPGKAILAELILRGPQTPGELRARCSRMHAFGDLDAVVATLEGLAELPRVEELPRSPGQKERRWRHLLGAAAGGPATPDGGFEGGGAATVAPAATAAGDTTRRLAALEHQVVELANRLERLEAKVER